jgi:hypothetical protein
MVGGTLERECGVCVGGGGRGTGGRPCHIGDDNDNDNDADDACECSVSPHLVSFEVVVKVWASALEAGERWWRGFGCCCCLCVDDDRLDYGIGFTDKVALLVVVRPVCK